MVEFFLFVAFAILSRHLIRSSRRVHGSLISVQKSIDSLGIQKSYMASANSTRDPQKWRGKYLRALNICPPNVEKPIATSISKNKVRSLTCRSSENDSQSLNRRCSSSSMDLDEGSPSFYPSPRTFAKRSTIPPPMMAHSHSCAAFPLTYTQPNPPLQPNMYPFAVKPLLARNRRCHTDPFDVDERMSAPIQIPKTRVNNQVDGNLRDPETRPQTNAASDEVLDRRRCSPICVDPAPVSLFTWEEPVAMHAAGQAITNGWNLQLNTSTHLNLGVSHYREQSIVDPEDHLHPDEEEEPDDIFEMEWEDTIGSKTRTKPTKQIPIHFPESRPETSHCSLSSSFIPPHQLKKIQQDCFSIGLRDEFKRLPTNPI